MFALKISGNTNGHKLALTCHGSNAIFKVGLVVVARTKFKKVRFKTYFEQGPVSTSAQFP